MDFSKLQSLTSDNFTPYLNQPFAISYEGQHLLDVVLVEVNNLGPEPDPDKPQTRRRAFSVIFRGPDTPVVRQHIYHIENADMGAYDFFLVPVGPLDGVPGVCYEAIFN